MQTGRIVNARRLRALPGVVTPRTVAIARDRLAGRNGAGVLAKHGFTFPLLLRSPGYHTGRNFILVETAAGLSPRRRRAFPATNCSRSNISTPAARTATRANIA